MGQRLQISRSKFFRYGRGGERLWLAALVEAMEQAARQPEACDGRTLAALRARLALPAQPRLAPTFSVN